MNTDQNEIVKQAVLQLTDKLYDVLEDEDKAKLFMALQNGTKDYKDYIEYQSGLDELFSTRPQ
ncbi:hypothetical protein ACQKDZ_19620 [Alkalihalobacillus sp. NPDC078480]